MKIKSGLILAGIGIGVFLCAGSTAACPKCFAAASHQVLNAYYVSMAFFVLIPAGIVGALVLWVSRQARAPRNLEELHTG